MFGFQFSAFRERKTVAGALEPLSRVHSLARVRWLLGAGALFSLFCALPSSAKPKVGRATFGSQSASGLGAGDVISVTVLRHPESSSENITIPSSGQINLPGEGMVPVRVAGLTPTQAARSIARALSRELVDPQVTVELKQVHPRRVFVSGAIAKTGTYDIQPNWRISEVLTAAGGVSGRLDEVVGTLTRAGLSPVRINLKAIQINPSSPANLRLREGDTLSFRALEAKLITVSGDVQRPGKYPLRTVPRLLEAITLAGELKGRADETTATLTRAGKLIALDVQAVEDNPSSPKNVGLKAGDILLFTVRDPKTITVSGDVQKQGAFPLRTAPRLLDALAEAGGPKEGIARSRATLFHRNGQKVALDLAQAQAQNTRETNVNLQDGDLIIVESIPLIQVTVSAPTTFVRNPGNLQLPPDSGVAQAVAQTGLTVLPEEVVATVVRGRQIIPVDLKRVGIDPVANFPLQNGDVINISEPDVIRIQVAGSVNKQGALRMAPGTTLLDALNRGAGGIASSLRPEDVRISVIRTRSKGASLVVLPTSNEPVGLPNALDGGSPTSNEVAAPQTQVMGDREQIAVNAVALLRDNDLRQNITLQDGDLVNVTQVKNPTVIVIGQVGKTGPYQIVEGEGITQLLARAGGATEVAALTRVVLQRGGERRVLDVYNEVKAGGKSSVLLQDGDTIIVPENTSRVTLINAVVKPGPIPIPEKHTLTVTEALNAAGGPRDRGIKEVGLLRPNPAVAGGVERRIVSLEKIYKGDLSQDVVLRPGDFIYVPDAKVPRAGLFGVLGQVIGTITGLRYVTGF